MAGSGQGHLGSWPTSSRAMIHAVGSSIRAIWRLLRVLGCVARGFLIQWVFFPRWSPAQRQQAVKDWSSRMLNAMNVRVSLSGEFSPGPVLMVCNHISWLDILVCHSQSFSRFVAKGEVHGWPVLGHMAQQAGTLFIERASRKDALRVVHDMAHALSAHDVVTIFPEGTTNNGLELLPFHANLIQAALVAQVPIQPIGLTYWTLCSDGVEAQLRVGSPDWARGRDRRQWSNDLRESVLKLIGS